MKNFFRNINGAVTIFVTLLLIPSVLVSGTAVDLARIHTAQSIIHNANQLASNALLTQYNALLNDVYGLFGIADDDPILWQLLNDYISVSVFGEDLQDRSLGTFQIFYGTDLTTQGVEFAEDKNLRNVDVLRRQIEDYMKYRAPVIIVTEFLDALDNNTIKEDSIVLGSKLAIESGILEMYEKYKQLYSAINRTDNIRQPIGGISGGSFGAVSSTLRAIRDDFVSLHRAYIGWRITTNPVYRSAFSISYTEILNSISTRVVGNSTRQGLNRTIENAKTQADNFKPNFDFVVTVAKEIDAMRERLIQAVDELENMLNSGQCSDDLRDALLKSYGTPPMTLIERYRQVLQWENIEQLAESYRDAGYSYIDDVVKPMLDGVKYRNENDASAESLSRTELATIVSDSRFTLAGGNTDTIVSHFAGFPAANVTYSMPPGFLSFAEISDKHNEFFEVLSIMINQPQIDPVMLYEDQSDAGGRNAEEQQRNLISALLNFVNIAYEGILNEPLGAMYIKDSGSRSLPSANMTEIVDLMEDALGSNMLSVLQDPVGSMVSAWEYMLLLSYCTSVFSNYTTSRPESIGKTIDDIGDIEFPISITNVPISPQINYFFQSEWEYLYNGEKCANANLSAVTRLIFLLRMVCNYIVVFSVPAINSIVTSIKMAFSWAPPLAVILGELARAAFVAAESLIDVILLRSGYQVPLLKKVSAGQWICTPTGVIAAIEKIMNDEVGGIYENGLTYSNYMIFLFVTRAVFSTEAGTMLTQRAGDLIEWNIINYQSFSFANEEKMSQALSCERRFQLVNMKTDFSITTTAQMRMLFLSMFFARNYASEIGTNISGTFPIKVTDHRGY